MEKYPYINTSLNIVQYMETVDKIAEAFFDVNGEYTPQWGKLGALTLFYSLFCKEEDENEVDSAKLEQILSDPSFVLKYESCLKGDERNGYFDFYSAYQDALRIVEYRKTAAGTVNSTIRFAIDKIGDLFNELTHGDKLDELAKFAAMIANGKLDRDALANMVINGIAERTQSDDGEGETVDNVVRFAEKD